MRLIRESLADVFAMVLVLALVVLSGCSKPEVEPPFDIIIRGGTVYDGSGGPPVSSDVGVRGDRIAAIGDLSGEAALQEIDAAGLAVAPGFINMLSWSTQSLLHDGRSQSELRQGVTLQVMGEGWSMGPVNERVAQNMEDNKDPGLDWDIEWVTLGDYLDHLVNRGISTNVASFVGATTLRIYAIGNDDRPPTDDELEEMRALVRQAMEEGALGVGSSLIYAPAFYADTDELIALVGVAAEYGGGYISHIRSEGARLLEAVDELIEIARATGTWAEIYHLKAAGKSNYDKLDEVIAHVEAARAEGLQITADIYTYPAAATGLYATMPPWVQEGGLDAWIERIRDPEIRRRVAEEMRTPTDEWENYFVETGPENILLVGFKNPELRSLTGKTLAEVATERGTSPAETAMDLVIEDHSRVDAVYFVMTEDNVRKKVGIPWVSFGSDEASQAPEGPFLDKMPHPRAYGTFTRLLGRYVREEGLIPLEEAIRRLTSLPAERLELRGRGRLTSGYYADVVVFDPAAVQDHATFEEPHQYSTGVVDVLVNGVPVILDGEHTGATPGQVVRGPGWTGW